MTRRKRQRIDPAAARQLEEQFGRRQMPYSCDGNPGGTWFYHAGNGVVWAGEGLRGLCDNPRAVGMHVDARPSVLDREIGTLEEIEALLRANQFIHPNKKAASQIHLLKQQVEEIWLLASA